MTHFPLCVPNLTGDFFPNRAPDRAVVVVVVVVVVFVVCKYACAKVRC